MNKSPIFKTFFLSLCILANTSLSYAQTASILPPAKTQYLDNNGKPLAAGKVFNYVPSSSTLKTTWQDAAESIPNTNPVILDGGGRALILGEGSYRQVVKDRLDNIIWDAVTSASGSGGGTPSVIVTGDGDLVGTIKPWAGMTAPTQYVFAYGQEVSRSTYSVLFTAITSSQSVFCSSGSPILTGVTDTTNFWIGMAVEINCLAGGFSTVIAKTSNTVTLAANANITAGATALFFPWGRGNGSTTFNLPDFRGLVPAGNNNMGGTASSNLTTTYFGATNPNSSGALGGSQSRQFLQAYLPAGNFAVTVTGTASVTSTQTNVIQGTIASSDAGGGSSGQLSSPSAPNVSTAITSTGTIAGTGNAATGGSGTLFPTVTPTRTTNYIIKITPDTSATISSASCLIFSDAGTACQADTGTSGHTVPFLDGNNTFSGRLNNLSIAVAASPTAVDIQSSLSVQQPFSVTGTAASILANPTNAFGSTVSTTIQGLNTVAALDTNLDYFLMYDHVTGQLRKATATQIGASSGGVAGVSSLGGVAGSIALNEGFTIPGSILTYGTAITTISTSTTVSGRQKIFLCDATAGSLAISIPAANTMSNGATITIKRKDNAIGNNCSVVVSGGGTIDGQVTLGVAPQYASFTLTTDGSTQWWVN